MIEFFDKIALCRELQRLYGIGLAAAKKYLELADYEMNLAKEIAEYYCFAVNKSYTIGKVIHDYWRNKDAEIKRST